MKYSIFLVLPVVACAPVDVLQDPPGETAVETTTPAPPPNARTVEQFDTTTEAERAAASSSASGGRRLGETVASLGDAATPGFWVQTPLVDQTSSGRVVNVANGKSVEVELRPVDGSSRVSLAALRLLEAPLTGLVTLEVFKG